jgi:ribosome biogenesis protein BMS1
MEDGDQGHVAHKKTKAGRGQKEAKKEKLMKEQGTQKARDNPRAFSVAKVGKTKKRMQRNMDRSQKKEVVPLKDRRVQGSDDAVINDMPPPAVVVVMGPKGVGKSTLIKSLVKLYTNHTLKTTAGPITVVTGKKKSAANSRVTFIECPSDDTGAMMDLAKIADLVLLLIDAKFGFEMETFEFLNMLQTTGFPKVMGVLTHLDQFKENTQKRNAIKTLKNRFWTEVYQGAKMFHFSGTINGKYLKNEVKQLSMFLGRVKVRFVQILK